MKDETYLFFSDMKEKKTTARSARNKRTHCGKGGRVRLPHDNLTKKELQKMNGECKSYRLNDPVKWDEFKAMPDDIKATYIKLIRQKFNPPNTMIAQMMGVSEMKVRRELKKLGLEAIQRSGRMKLDKEGFYAWMHGVDKLPTPVPAEEPIQEEQLPVITSVEPETYVEEDLPFEKPDPVTDADVIGCLEKQIDDLTAVLEKSEAENGWLRNECDNQRMQIRILEAQMEVVRMIFGGKNHG